MEDLKNLISYLEYKMENPKPETDTMKRYIKLQKMLVDAKNYILYHGIK